MRPSSGMHCQLLHATVICDLLNPFQVNFLPILIFSKLVSYLLLLSGLYQAKFKPLFVNQKQIINLLQQSISQSIRYLQSCYDRKHVFPDQQICPSGESKIIVHESFDIQPRSQGASENCIALALDWVHRQTTGTTGQIRFRIPLHVLFTCLLHLASTGITPGCKLNLAKS